MTKEPMDELKSTIAERTQDSTDQQNSREFLMSLICEVNMTTCYKHCKHFFERYENIHFNVLIAYWMMAGYLSSVDSVEKAYKRGHDLLLKLMYQEGNMLKCSDQDPDMVEFGVTSTNSQPFPCFRHQGLCALENHGFADLFDLDQLGNGVVLTDGMLKTVPKSTIQASANQPNNSMLLMDGNHLSRQVFHPPKKLKCLAYFEPRPDSLNHLLKKVNRQLSVLLLRYCEFLKEIDLPLEKFKTLTALEISGLNQVNDVPSILMEKVSDMKNLRYLNISGLLIEKLPDFFFSKLEELQWVILRGCSKLRLLPSVRPLKKLKMLDLSHCSSLQKSATVEIQCSQLQMFDLSYTDMRKIPVLRGTSELTHLFLRDSKVHVLNTLKKLKSLQVLDLSGAEKVIVVDQIKENKNIIVLNLSRTSIKSIEFLSDLIDLRTLLLKKCTDLEELPAIKNLTNLEVLDMSGCEKLRHLPEDLSTLKNLRELNLSGCSDLELREGLFDYMSCLQKLDLSGTKIQVLPSLANLTGLCNLSLRGLQTASLEILASLSNLEVLDLNGLQIISPQKSTFGFIQSLMKLQILNLSNTPIAQLPDLSELKSLKELILANCQQLEVVPDLQTLTNLEMLDLSLPNCFSSNKFPAEAEIEGQREIQLSVPPSCRKLVLKNRFAVKKLVPLTSYGELEYLDFRGTDVEKIPYESMAQVKCFQLPAKIDLIGVCLIRKGDLQETIDWKGNLHGHIQGKTSDATEIQIAPAICNKSYISAGAKQFFHLKNSGNQGSWEAFVHQFSASLPHKESNSKTIFLDGDEFIFRDDLSWARRLLNLELKGRSVEIHGFSEAPDNIQNLLQQPHAENVAFVVNDFLCTISDLFSKTINTCCIRRCQKLKSVLSAADKNGVNAKCSERLILSDLVALELIYDSNVSPVSIESLKHIHIDYCPNLTKVIISSPVPEHLETLHIKFCDKLQTIFENTVSLSNLRQLNLFELSKLEAIEADLPSLETLSIRQCPELKSLGKVIKSASSSLTELCLDSCHMLEHVLPSSLLLEKLQVLKISYCKTLVTLVNNTGSSLASLPNLQTLRLWSLPMLKSIGADLSFVPNRHLDPSLPPSINQQLRSHGQ